MRKKKMDLKIKTKRAVVMGRDGLIYCVQYTDAFGKALDEKWFNTKEEADAFEGSLKG